MKKRSIAYITSGVLLGTTLLTGAALAQGSAMGMMRGRMGGNSTLHMQKPAVVGSVTSVSGTTLTVTDKSGTVFTIDGASAKITKGFDASSITLGIANVKVGDNVAVLGTISGNAVAATAIMDGANPMHGERPALLGAITSVNGNVVTITDKSGVVFTVDATNAKISKGFGEFGTTIALADLKVGDEVGVLGTKSGQAVTATAIMDGMGPHGGRTGTFAQMGIGGTVAKVNGSIFTVTMPDFKDKTNTTTGGTTYTVSTSGTTTYTKDGAAASLNDIVVGARVMVSGTVDTTKDRKSVV